MPYRNLVHYPTRNKGWKTPAIAITFSSTREHDEAVTMMMAWNNDEAKRQVDTTMSGAASNKNIIWAIRLRTATEQKLQELVSIVLASPSYRSTYQYEECGIVEHGRFRIQGDVSQPWPASVKSQSMAGS